VNTEILIPLAEQSFNYAYQKFKDMDVDPERYHHILIGITMEHFAGLIVKECIDVVPWMYEEKIKQHFGVK
jgi:hypothetical protein